MYKRILNSLAVISFLGMLVVPVVQAQSHIQVSIPFQFNVGKAVLPPGEYRVKTVNSSTLMIQRKDGRQGAMAMTIGVSSKAGDQAKLVFNRYGTQYFLSKVWSAGNPVGRELLKSHTEIEVAKNLSKPEVTNVAIKRP
jgi:hypothetical protein